MSVAEVESLATQIAELRSLAERLFDTVFPETIAHRASCPGCGTDPTRAIDHIRELGQ